MKWSHSLYGSGSQTVTSDAVPRGPYFYVCHAAADNEGQHLRTEIASELTVWLNGSEEPWWLEFLKRKDARTVVTPHGSEIQITGPMVDRATPPQWGEWWEDDSADAQIARGLLTDCLMQRKRPT